MMMRYTAPESDSLGNAPGRRNMLQEAAAAALIHSLPASLASNTCPMVVVTLKLEVPVGKKGSDSAISMSPAPSRTESTRSPSWLTSCFAQSSSVYCLALSRLEKTMYPSSSVSPPPTATCSGSS
jgi:hypothetical protein